MKCLVLAVITMAPSHMTVLLWLLLPRCLIDSAPRIAVYGQEHPYGSAGYVMINLCFFTLAPIGHCCQSRTPPRKAWRFEPRRAPAGRCFSFFTFPPPI